MRNVKYLKNGYDANNLREHIALATIIRIPRRVRVNPEFQWIQFIHLWVIPCVKRVCLCFFLWMFVIRCMSPTRTTIIAACYMRMSTFCRYCMISTLCLGLLQVLFSIFVARVNHSFAICSFTSSSSSSSLWQNNENDFVVKYL